MVKGEIRYAKLKYIVASKEVEKYRHVIIIKEFCNKVIVIPLTSRIDLEHCNYNLILEPRYKLMKTSMAKIMNIENVEKAMIGDRSIAFLNKKEIKELDEKLLYLFGIKKNFDFGDEINE